MYGNRGDAVHGNVQTFKKKFDEEELIELEEYTIEELQEKIFTGEIRDSKTVAGLLAYAAKEKKNN